MRPIKKKNQAQAVALKQGEHHTLVRLIIAFGLLFVIAAFSASKVQAADTIKILSFGDSLSAGYQLPPGTGFTDQLQKTLDADKLNVEVINAAVSGDTTATGLSRLDWSTPDGIDLVLLELGANDALQGLPVDRAKANLAAMIEKFQNRNITVGLIGMRAPPNMGADYVKAFDALYPALAKQYAVPFYPFFLEDVAAMPELNLSDGMHPNEEGIKIIVKKIAPFVKDIVKSLN